MILKNKDLLESSGAHSNLSLATTQNLNPVFMGLSKTFSVQLVFTGTPAGNFKLQVSNDVSPTNWDDVDDTQTTVNAAGSLYIEYPVCGAEWVRVVYTATGAGTAPVLTVARIAVKD